jgi:PilZ domain
MSASGTQDGAVNGGGVLQSSLRVEWREGGESLSEMTRLLDADLQGAAFALSRQLELGQMLKLTLPAVFENLRLTPDEKQSETWALVWAVTPARAVRAGAEGRTRHVTRVIFFGMDVPRSFTENSGEPCLYEADGEGRFRLRREATTGEQSSQANRRRESRLHLPYEVTVEVLGEDGEVTATELAITENVSRSGALVRTTLALRPDTRVRLSCARVDFTVSSIVRASHTGPDQIRRMHLEFLDGQWPL